MKFNQFRFILFFSVAVMLSSCNWLDSNTPAEPSSDAYFVSLKFTKNDSILNLETAVFTVDADSTIVNLDSLPYQTRIDSVLPVFAFKSTLVAYLYFQNGDSILLTGKDTVDFTQVTKVRNIAEDRVTSKTYPVKVNVHQVDAELYVWDQANPGIYTPGGTNQKGIIFKDNFFFYVNSGAGNNLYTSANGYDWTPGTVTGLPISNTLGDMTEFNGKLYLSGEGNRLYSTANGTTWENGGFTLANHNLVTLLLVLDSKLLAVAKRTTDNKYYFTSSTNGSDWVLGDTIQANFPIRDFAAISVSTRNGKQKALVMGGVNADGMTLKNRWSTQDGKYWVDFSRENRTADTLATGASLFAYDNKLFAIGLRNDKTEPALHYLVSVDEGLSWKMPNNVYNSLPDAFEPRSYISAVVFKPRAYNKADSKTVIEESNRIFLMGGKTESDVYSNVWTGKLNRKNFLVQ